MLEKELKLNYFKEKNNIQNNKYLLYKKEINKNLELKYQKLKDESLLFDKKIELLILENNSLK